MNKNYKIRTLNAEQTAELAVESMLDEAVTWPKPGLVDPINHDGHPDMDIYTFINSSVTMSPYFIASWQLGNQFWGNDLTELFKQLRPLGVKAEKLMFAVTHGVNTHKGIVFILGIMLAALGYVIQKHAMTITDLMNVEKAMTKGLVKNDLVKLTSSDLTAGQKQYQKLGLTGIRGAAEAGFPIVLQHSFTFYKQLELNENDKNLITLLKIVTLNGDSNLIKRADNLDLVNEIKHDAQVIINEYQNKDTFNKDELNKLCEKCKTHNLSLGGSADLLVLTIFLNRITE